MYPPNRTIARLPYVLLMALLALLTNGCEAPSDNRDSALAELAQRGISIDMDGLKASTRTRSYDGAFLFDEIGFFDDISDADLKETLLHAAKSDNFGLARVLERLDSRVQFDASELQESLDIAVRRGSGELTAALLRHGARPGPETLFQAAYADDYQQAEMLLQHDTDFTGEPNNEAVRMAARLGNLQTLKAFVDSGKAPDEQVYQALRFGALTEQAAVVRYLVEWGVPVDHPDSDGCTALHYLAQDGLVEDVRYLVDQGAAVNQTCRGKETPLKWAHYGKNQPVIDYLLSVGGTQL
ncbi:ankyrin repeat domain-containing protein [Halopseudomonas salina]|uniref:Ankyrin repeat domain-containing protein n=1 Tax=Halopseudomonas salina TaxID=1323744 RepID=A0ABQ1PA81_9GAMM|nr:ankyrin repeat domain-containing protein [Halopseudomonas salina]GGC93888.1 hypothetical protein GCM10007418_11780 [Halopseudomonas salina]